VLYDPAAEDSTCRDARYCFVYDDMPRDAFETRFKGKIDSDFYAADSTRADGEWIGRETVRLVEYWCVEESEETLQLLTDGTTRWKSDKAAMALGVTVKQERASTRKKVCMYLCSGVEVLEETEWAGDRIPIVPVWGEEARIGNKRIRNGVLTYARDAIRLHSFARSANAETVATQPKAPWLVTPKMIDGFQDQWQSAATGNPAVLFFNPDPSVPSARPERMPPPQPSSGWVQEALQSADDIKTTTGIFDASLGAKSNETSGKAILARQREGDIGTYTFVDNVMDAIEETGRIAINVIPHIYDAPREVRILGKKMEAQIVAVNQAWLHPSGQTVHIDLTVGKYDVTVSTGPSVTTQRQETAELLTSALQAAPMLAPVILPRLASVIDLPDAEEFAAEVKALMQPQQDGQQQQMQMQAAQLTMAEQEAKVHKLQAEAVHTMAKAQAEGSPEGDPQAAQFDLALKAAQLRQAEAQADEAQANAGIAYATLAKLADPVAAEAEAMQTVAEAHQAAAQASQAHIKTASDMHDLQRKPMEAAHQAADLKLKLNPPEAETD
jgi:hypothetical protein